MRNSIIQHIILINLPTKAKNEYEKTTNVKHAAYVIVVLFRLQESLENKVNDSAISIG